MSIVSLASLVLPLCLAPAPAAPSPSLGPGPSERGTERASGESTAKTSWIRAWLPKRGQWELGAFSGAIVLGGRHDYYDPATAPQVRLGRAAPMAGLRAAYFPLSFIGVEAEGWGAWTQVPAREAAPAFLYAMRGQVVAQLPFWRVAPFVLGGYGLTGVRSPRDVVGSDVDPAGHYGIGAKLFVDGRFAVRLEGRHMLTPARARRFQVANHFTVLLGLSVRLGPEPSVGPRGTAQPPTQAPPPAPPAPPPPVAPAPDETFRDGDGDGVRDASDACPELAGITPHGCPALDYDSDGVPDSVDPCPSVAGDGSGCPAPSPAPTSASELPAPELVGEPVGSTPR